MITLQSFDLTKANVSLEHQSCRHGSSFLHLCGHDHIYSFADELPREDREGEDWQAWTVWNSELWLSLTSAWLKALIASS
jgi:ssRNA-specific RNase YbeY (16S rRNA maturation enzyme)